MGERLHTGERNVRIWLKCLISIFYLKFHSSTQVLFQAKLSDIVLHSAADVEQTSKRLKGHLGAYVCG